MTRTRPRASLQRVASALVVVTLMLATSACAGFGRLGEQPGVTTLTVATVNNPQMQDLATLVPEYERTHPGVKINLLFMEENDLRTATTKDVATGGGQYDLMTVGSYEIPIWGRNGWLADLTDRAKAPGYDLDDFFGPVREAATVDGRLRAVPFYGESSFLMYRKDLFAEAGLTMPEHPTWQQVADLAAKLKTPKRAGICLRGKPGWGEQMAAVTTLVNTFGGQWFDQDWNARVTDPAFARAVQFYVDTLRASGEGDAASYGFTECLNLFQSGGAAMWYDATSAAGQLESDDSPAKGRIGYVEAPVEKTKESGWLWSWNLGVNASSEHQDAAWEFARWATSKEYAQLVGERIGWSNLPPGTRRSTYANPQYAEASRAFAPLTSRILSEVDPVQPGVAPQPWVGIQYVTIPEWQDLGNQTSQAVADAIAGRRSVADALQVGQTIAERAGREQKGQR